VERETRPANDPAFFVCGRRVTGRDGKGQRVQPFEQQRPAHQAPERERVGPRVGALHERREFAAHDRLGLGQALARASRQLGVGRRLQLRQQLPAVGHDGGDRQARLELEGIAHHGAFCGAPGRP